MKRVLAILLIVVYSVLTSVSAINLHFCHGNLVDFALNKPVKSCCDDAETVSKPCCTNIAILVDLDKNQLTQPSLSVEPVKEISTIYSVVSESPFDLIIQSSVIYKNLNAPPNEPLEDLYCLNHSFLFYG